MKKGVLLVSLVILLSISLVAAQEGVAQDISKFIDSMLEVATPLVAAALGDVPGGVYLFAKFLFLILILAIVWYGLEQIGFFAGNKWAHWIVAIVVAILATRWIATEEIIDTIILPYSTLGVAIAAGLPFVIWFAIINLGFSGFEYKTFRKIAWVLFAVVFLFLWVYRYEELGSAAWIYPLTALISIIILIFDGTISQIIGRIRIEKKMSITDIKLRNQLMNELQELKETRRDLIKRGEPEKNINKISRQIDGLTKRIAKI